jgi:hypothetical protein
VLERFAAGLPRGSDPAVEEYSAPDSCQRVWQLGAVKASLSRPPRLPEKLHPDLSVQ